MCLLGGGGHALVVYESAVAAGWRVDGFFDDDASAGLSAYASRLGGLSDLLDGSAAPPAPALLAVGSISLRKRVLDALADRAEWVTVVHPSATISPLALLGHGGWVGPNAVVNGRTRMGEHALVNSSAVVEHDCRVGDNVHLAPRCVLGGRVTIGSDTLVGIGATVLPGAEIGSGAIVGGGAVVTRSVDDHATAIGVPARTVRRAT